MSDALARQIAALLGSRICHDLISPIGAISNGVELLAMSGVQAGPEVALIAESVDNANARVKFFRVAFGMASEGQTAPRAEMASIFAGLNSARLTMDWAVTEDALRDEAKLACLMVMCLETALPRGGAIRVCNEDGKWTVEARSDRLAPAAELWARLGSVTAAEGLKPSEIQFLLAPLQASLLGRKIGHETREDYLKLTA